MSTVTAIFLGGPLDGMIAELGYDPEGRRVLIEPTAADRPTLSIGEDGQMIEARETQSGKPRAALYTFDRVREDGVQVYRYEPA